MLHLYITHDAPNVIRKHFDLVDSFEIRLKEITDVINPNIRLRVGAGFDVNSFNYAGIESFGRYYFVDNARYITNDIIQFDLSCDVLETYQDEILATYCEVSRVPQNSDYGIMRTVDDVRKVYLRYDSDKELLKSTSIVLTTIGG